MNFYGLLALVVLAACRYCSLCEGGGRLGYPRFTELGGGVALANVHWEPCYFCGGSGWQPPSAPDWYEGGDEWLESGVEW